MIFNVVLYLMNFIIVICDSTLKDRALIMVTFYLIITCHSKSYFIKYIQCELWLINVSTLTETAPLLFSVSPSMAESSEDFPLPTWPTTATSEPQGTLTLILLQHRVSEGEVA